MPNIFINGVPSNFESVREAKAFLATQAAIATKKVKEPKTKETKPEPEA